MFDRRTFISVAAALPFAGTSLRLDIPDPRIHELNTGGVHVIGISPDASLLVGMTDRQRICILDAKTRETLAETTVTPELRLLDEASISWSPDGSRIAFSLKPWVALRDSDIFVMDVVTGELTNATPEGNGDEAHALLDTLEANVDTSPIWLDEDTLIYARHRFAKDEDIAVSLTRLTIADGTIESWVDLSAAGVQSVNHRIWRISDGSLVFEVDIRDDRSRRNSVMVVNANGAFNEIGMEEPGPVRLIDVNDTHRIVASVLTSDFWYIPLDDPTGQENLWERFGLPENVSLLSEPTFGPEPDTLLVAARTTKDQTMVYLLDGSEATKVAELRGETGPLTCHWAEDVILITSGEPSWLIMPED